MDVINKVKQAFLCVIKNDQHLLSAQANERSITHKFAIYIAQAFPEFDVDCEYNRDGIDPKRLEKFRKRVDSDDTKGTTVYPDVIVHRRGTEENFVVIEAKHSANTQRCSESSVCRCDRCKLCAYKSDLGYQRAFYVEFPVGKKPEHYSIQKLDAYIEEIK